MLLAAFVVSMFVNEVYCGMWFGHVSSFGSYLPLYFSGTVILSIGKWISFGWYPLLYFSGRAISISKWSSVGCYSLLYFSGRVISIGKWSSASRHFLGTRGMATSSRTGGQAATACLVVVAVWQAWLLLYAVLAFVPPTVECTLQ
jgi:hypothetical protein